MREGGQLKMSLSCGAQMTGRLKELLSTEMRKDVGDTDLKKLLGAQALTY